MGVLIGSSSLISFAVVNPVVSTLEEPEYYHQDNVTIYNVVYYDSGSVNNSPYRYNQLKLIGSSNLQTYKYNNSWTTSSEPFSFEWALYDAIDGRLLQSNSGNSVLSGSNYQVFTYNSSVVWVSGWYLLAPENVSAGNPTSNYSEPFITWSVKPAEHNIYHSSLSEPVADEYNSYFIANDHLIWLSYRFNGLYSYSSNIELASEIYSGSGSYSGTDSGQYAGQMNGLTESVSFPDGDVAGVSSGDNTTGAFVGQYSGFDFGQIDFSGVANGIIRTSSNGDITFNNKVVYPVAYDRTEFNHMFSVYCVMDTQNTLRFVLAPNTNQLQGLIADVSFYVSEFQLEDGTYLNSNYQYFANDIQSLFYTYNSDDDIGDVKAYGIAFLNGNNFPVNLSDVIWGYDLEFVEWRENMLSRLDSIYQVLSEAQSMPEAPTTAQWGNELDQVEPKPQVSPAEVQSIYNVAGNDLNQQLGDSAATLHEWVDIFSVPKLITLVAFSLTIGTAILILGKKKSE